jgi:hypothetical protein
MKNFLFFLKIKTYNFKEQLKIFSYYKCLKFFILDITFLLIYLFNNPYRTCRKFSEKFSKKTNYYGETPLSTMEKIIKETNILSLDFFIELGSGRGRSTFWISHFVKCKIVGIEWIFSFVSIANFLTKIYRLKNISFIKENFMNIDLSPYSVVYLYGTCLGDEEILVLIEKFKKMSKKAKIITISFPLKDYDKAFLVKKAFEVSFPWGKTNCYLNQRIS